MERFRCVSLVLYTDSGKCFLQDREGISRSGEEWAFFGGHIEAGENKQEALLREIKEELDYDLADPIHLGQVSAVMPRIEPPHTKRQVIANAFAKKVPEDVSLFRVGEGKRGKFFTFEEIHQLILSDLGDRVFHQFLDVMGFVQDNTEVREYVSIFPYTSSGKVLLQDRRSIQKYGEEWAPFGGRVDAGESIEQTAVREIREELDYELDKFYVLGTVSTSRKHKHPPHAEIQEKIHVVATLVEDDASLFVDHEGDGAHFFTREEVKDLKLTSLGRMAVDLLLEKGMRG